MARGSYSTWSGRRAFDNGHALGAPRPEWSAASLQRLLEIGLAAPPRMRTAGFARRALTALLRGDDRRCRPGGWPSERRARRPVAFRLLGCWRSSTSAVAVLQGLQRRSPPG
ncbi:MAG: hypothetical protein MZV64_59405 [Ignavibacteriales bacterium]|nr:hypothetical protein [Ignavibacteriales bacterium]